MFLKRVQRFAVSLLNRWLSSRLGLACFCCVLLIASLSSCFVALVVLQHREAVEFGNTDWFGLTRSGGGPADKVVSHVYKYEPVCSSTNNIAGKNLGLQRCAEDIDVVFTWVNGSDPIWHSQMSTYKHGELMRRK